MKKNRKRQKLMSVSAARSMYFGAAVLMLFLMVILNLLAESRCEQVIKSIGEKETKLSVLRKERDREQARWDSLTDDANLNRVLGRLGMSMKYAKSSQLVYMDSSGKPHPGQLSVVADQRRRGEKPVAKTLTRKRR